jgi:hypothetical protein
VDKTQVPAINQHYENNVKQCKLTWNKPNKDVREKLKKNIKNDKKTERREG